MNCVYSKSVLSLVLKIYYLRLFLSSLSSVYLSCLYSSNQELTLYLFHKMGFHAHNYELRVPLIKTFQSYGSVQLSHRFTDWLKVILDAIWLLNAVLDPLELDVEAQLNCCPNILSRAYLFWLFSELRKIILRVMDWA